MRTSGTNLNAVDIERDLGQVWRLIHSARQGLRRVTSSKPYTLRYSALGRLLGGAYYYTRFGTPFDDISVTIVRPFPVT